MLQLAEARDKPGPRHVVCLRRGVLGLAKPPVDAVDRWEIRSHHLEAMLETSFGWYLQGNRIVPRILRWCRISSIDSMSNCQCYWGIDIGWHVSVFLRVVYSGLLDFPSPSG